MSHALYMDEEGNAEVYKVDQLTAMKWCIQAWKDINAITISNCWKATGIIGTEDTVTTKVTDTLADDGDAHLDSELRAMIEDLGVRNPMSIAEFLNPIYENDSLMECPLEQLCEDANLLRHLEEAEEVEVPEVEDDPVVEKQKYSNSEKLKCIAKAMEILESSESFNPDSYSKVIIRLMNEKRLIQEEIKKSFVQPTITSFFKK